MSKNPYEIRLDVLKMAQEMLDKEKSIEEMKYVNTLDTMRSSNVHNAEIVKYASENAPKMYDEQELVARSTSLYNFISEKK